MPTDPPTWPPNPPKAAVRLMPANPENVTRPTTELRRLPSGGRTNAQLRDDYARGLKGKVCVNGKWIVERDATPKQLTDLRRSVLRGIRRDFLALAGRAAKYPEEFDAMLREYLDSTDSRG